MVHDIRLWHELLQSAQLGSRNRSRQTREISGTDERRCVHAIQYGSLLMKQDTIYLWLFKIYIYTYIYVDLY